VVLKVENVQASFARLMDDAFAQAFATPISPFKPTLLAPTVTVTGQQHTASVARPPSAPSEPSSVTESTSSGVSMVFSPPAKRVAKKPVVRNRRGVVVCVFPFKSSRSDGKLRAQLRSQKHALALDNEDGGGTDAPPAKLGRKAFGAPNQRNPLGKLAGPNADKAPTPLKLSNGTDVVET
jgi:hypothetical protein